MIGQVAWDDKLQKLVLSVDGKVAVTSKNIGYIKRCVREQWDQVKSLGITEFVVIVIATNQATATPIAAQEPYRPVFGALINTQELLSKLSVPPPGRRGRGRPRKPKQVIGIINHRESNSTTYQDVPTAKQERLIREYQVMPGSIREKVLVLADKYSLTYRQTFELISP